MKNTFIKSSFIIKVLIISILIIITLNRFSHTYTSWDMFGYYLYLPATFIYKDTGLKDPSTAIEMMQKYELSATFYQIVPVKTGNNIIKYSSGLALIIFPFFLIAHLLALSGFATPDGFSFPYQLAVYLSAVFFIIIGVIYTEKIIRKIFNDKISAITSILLYLGTNLFFINTHITGVHLYMFGMYAFFIWQTIKWHETPTVKKSMLIGFVAGLLTLTRPTDFICILIPLLWGVYNKETLSDKIKLLKKHSMHIKIIVIFGLIAVTPQIIYWLTYTGKLIFYSYDNPGEGLDFLTPYVKNVLFGYRKGWFIYTPMMIFVFLGFKTLYKLYRQAFYPALIFTVLNIYLISSWTCWWYAGSFGHRAFVHSYPLLAIPLGSFVFNIFSEKKLLRYISLLFMLFFIILNLFQNWQYDKKIRGL